jgi:hypothetical protein
MQIYHAVLLRFHDVDPNDGSTRRIQYADPKCGSYMWLHNTDPKCGSHCGSALWTREADPRCGTTMQIPCGSEMQFHIVDLPADPFCGFENQCQIHTKTGFHADLEPHHIFSHTTTSNPVPDPQENWFSCGSGSTLPLLSTPQQKSSARSTRKLDFLRIQHYFVTSFNTHTPPPPRTPPQPHLLHKLQLPQNLTPHHHNINFNSMLLNNHGHGYKKHITHPSETHENDNVHTANTLKPPVKTPPPPTPTHRSVSRALRPRTGNTPPMMAEAKGSQTAPHANTCQKKCT